MVLRYIFLVLLLFLAGCYSDTDTYTNSQSIEDKDEGDVSIDSKEKIYTVAKGDTLDSIAKKFNTTAKAIRKRNYLTSDIIIEGKTLFIPYSGTSTVTSDLPEKPAGMSNEKEEVLKTIKIIKDDQNAIKNLLADISNKMPKDIKPSTWKSIINIAIGSFIGVAILIVLWLVLKKLYRIVRRVPESNESQKLATEISNKVVGNPHINRVKNELIREVTDRIIGTGRIIGFGDLPINLNQLHDELNTLKNDINYFINTINNRIKRDISLKEPSLTATESDKAENVLRDKIEPPVEYARSGIEPSKKRLPLYLDDSGKLRGCDKSSVKYNAKRRRPPAGFGISEKFFEEDIDGNFVITPEQCKPEKAICFPLDVSSLKSDDLVYTVEKSKDTKGWKIEKLARCKKVGNKWVLDGVEGIISGSARY